jgi:predicted GIY-YIG superfamily endonuclease
MPTTAAWSVYVLQCADGSYYTGVTNDLTRRLDQHGAGTASKYTRCRRPVRLACTLGSWPTRGAALRLEARIKAMTRAQKQRLVDDGGGQAPALRERAFTTSRPGGRQR